MERPPRFAPGVRRAGTRIAFAIVLAVAAALRLAGVGWDDGTHLHPDERFVTMVTTALGRGSLRIEGPHAAERLAACKARHPAQADGHAQPAIFIGGRSGEGPLHRKVFSADRGERKRGGKRR